MLLKCTKDWGAVFMENIGFELELKFECQFFACI